MTVKTITVPDIGGATDVDVIEVLVKAGDTIAVDTPLITLESDKATMEVPSDSAGVVKEVKVKVGDKVAQGSVIVTLEGQGETAATKPAPAAQKTAAKAASAPAAAKSAAPAAVSQTFIPREDVVHAGGDIHAGPGVRKLARELGVDLHQIHATGPKSRILREDLHGFVKARLAQVPTAGGSALPAAPQVDFTKFGPVETQSLSKIKKLTAKNLHRNWLLIPHVTQFDEADITDTEEFRLSQRAQFEKQGVKLTLLAFIMKAVVTTLKAFPQFNASLDASGENLILKKYFHIGVAVDTPDGLVVPVVRDVDKKGLKEIAKELGHISEKARNKQLLPQDMQGGCFSISSLGGIGGTAFTPIINLPEVAILGVSKSSYKPVYEEGEFVPRLMLPLSLSYDHRVIDGAEGARFLVHLRHTLGDIRNLLL